MTFNEDDTSGIAAAVDIARDADTVILAIGEEAFQTGEGRSQVDVGLKGVQKQLLKEVSAVNDRVVVVLMNGRPLVIDWMAANIPAIVEAWHLGSQAGHAIADVLFGDFNPSGKLPGPTFSPAIDPGDRTSVQADCALRRLAARGRSRDGRATGS